MSKELLKALVDVLDDLKLRKNLSEDDALNISDSVLVRAEKAIENYLTQPEQEPVYWENEKKALLNEIDHLTNRLAQPEQTEPVALSEEEIKEATKNMSEFGADMFKAGIMAAEKAHGIGE